jgi:branched-chain amino acid transport system ATP-binding protein
MLLNVENLRVSYGNIKALHGIDCISKRARSSPSSGPTVPAKAPPCGPFPAWCRWKSRVPHDLHGTRTCCLEPDKVVSQLGISHVPEGRRLFGNLTVMENLQLATFARKDKDRRSQGSRAGVSIFERLKERESQKAGTLSGGEQQMLAIGRAFMSGRG